MSYFLNILSVLRAFSERCKSKRGKYKQQRIRSTSTTIVSCSVGTFWWGENIKGSKGQRGIIENSTESLCALYSRACVMATSLLVCFFLIASSQCSFPVPWLWGPIIIWPKTSSEVRRSWFMILMVIEYSSILSFWTSNKKPWFHTGFIPLAFFVCLLSSSAPFAFKVTQTYGAVKKKSCFDITAVCP